MNSFLFMSDETNEKIKKWARDLARRHARKNRRGGCMACKRFYEKNKISGGKRMPLNELMKQIREKNKISGGRYVSIFEKIKKLIWKKKQKKIDEEKKKMEELEEELRAIDDEDRKANAPQPQPQLPRPNYIPSRPPPRPYYEPEPEPAYNTYRPEELITHHQTQGLNEYFANPDRTDVDFYFMKQEYDPSLNMILPTY